MSASINNSPQNVLCLRLMNYMSSRRGSYPPRPSQNRTCGATASGPSTIFTALSPYTLSVVGKVYLEDTYPISLNIFPSLGNFADFAYSGIYAMSALYADRKLTRI